MISDTNRELETAEYVVTLSDTDFPCTFDCDPMIKTVPQPPPV